MPKSRKEQLLEFLRDEPEDVFLNYAMALEHIRDSDREKAVLLLRKVLALDSGYLAAYYQLGKQMEQESREMALEIYLQGMEAAKKKKDNHAYNELRTAGNLLSGNFDEDEDY
jgi:tetratricopeptide (TPR) repeat protein